MSNEETAAALLPSLKGFLDITWDDPGGDAKLLGIALRGMSYVQRMTRRALLFEEGTAERTLLFEYCRYSRSGALDEFSMNYLMELLTFQQDEAVKAWEQGAEGGPE